MIEGGVKMKHYEVPVAVMAWFNEEDILTMSVGGNAGVVGSDDPREIVQIF